MRIAMVAPPFGPTGGPEVMVRNLISSLQSKNIQVTLFAPADWKTKAPLVETLPQSLWNMRSFSQLSVQIRRNYVMGSQAVVLAHQGDFDLIHLHAQRAAYAVARGSRIPCVVTLHSSIPEEDFLQMRESRLTVVGLTRSQVGQLPVDAVIRNGIPVEAIVPRYEPGEYLLAVGRITPQKGINQAITIAKKSNKKLIIIGRIGISKERISYFNEHIQPHVEGKQVQLVESVEHEKMTEFFRKASFLVFPITSPESNPLVPMEALACGTPVLGTRVDPLPEMFPQSGGAVLLSDNLDELADAAAHPEAFSRRAARQYAEKHLDSGRMADDYIALYRKLLQPKIF